MPSVIPDGKVSGYFNSSTLTTLSGTPPYTIPLADFVTGDTGDGTYEVNFVKNPNVVFGTGPTTPAICVTKSTGPFAGLPSNPSQVLKLYTFLVVDGSIKGNTDQRLAGGVTTENVVPGTVAIATCDDVDLAGLADGDLLQWNGTDWIPVEPPQSGAVLAPSDFKFNFEFSVPSTAVLTADDGTTDLTAHDGTTGLTTDPTVADDLTAEDGTTELLAEDGSTVLTDETTTETPQLNWWTDDGFASNIILYLPDGTEPTAAKSGSSISPNVYAPGGTSDVYLTAYATKSGGVWTITIVLTTYNPNASTIQPAWLSGVVPLVTKTDGTAHIGTLGSTASGVVIGGAGSGMI